MDKWLKLLDNSDVNSLHEKFEEWRRHKKGRGKIPYELWESSVTLSLIYGVSSISKLMRLNCSELLRRSKDRSAHNPEAITSFTEVKIPKSNIKNKLDCFLELEKAHGHRLRVHLKETTSAEILSILNDLWR